MKKRANLSVNGPVIGKIVLFGTWAIRGVVTKFGENYGWGGALVVYTACFERIGQFLDYLAFGGFRS